MATNKRHPNWGGARIRSGRPKTSNRNVPLMVRISPEAFEKLNAATNNKSEFIDTLLMQL